MNHLGLDNETKIQCDATETIIWLTSSKLPFDGECLACKGFENTHRLFAHSNILRCPRMLTNRNAKQCDVIELLTKGEHSDCTILAKLIFFFENVDDV